jgi:long-chain acyl-CoA synthetase
MQTRFHTAYNQPLQNAYGAWAARLRDDCIVAIALPNPEHTMAAFFACAHVGKRACIVTPDMLAGFDDTFVPLTTQLSPSSAPQSIMPSPEFITFTSGSTNRPKAILRDAKTWIYSFARNGIDADDTVAVMGNLSHSLAHYAATEAMFNGANVIFCPKRLTGDPTVIYATPTQIKLATSSAASNPNVRLVMIGGGHFTATDRQNCQQQFPMADIRIFYGTAETSFISIADETTPDGSVGQAYDGVKISIINGEVNVVTPMIAGGYLDKVKTFEQGIPFATGEIGAIDAQGNLFLQGRADRRVTLADKSVHLDAIEADLLAQHGITNAGVVALPDAARGLRAYACVQGIEANHPLLGGVLVLEEWPQLLSGKTDYVRLKQILAQAFA